MYYIDTEKLFGFTPIPNDFIDKYAGNIESTYIVVYMYIARHAIKGRLPRAEKIADRFSLSPDTAAEIISFWDSKGLFDKPHKPSYSPSEIAGMQKYNSEISGLISTAGAILGKALGQKEQSTVLSLYDWYKLPVEVITILLGHCAETNHTSLSYIEKIALDWSEKGIKTSEEAEDYLKLYYGDFSKVLKAFGITGRMANSKEKKYMEKWLVQYKLPLELVVEACEQATINTGKVSWKYADTTLTDWHKDGITTVEQAKKHMQEHSVKKNKDVSKPTTAKKPVRVSNRFSNFEEREYNRDELDSLALELLKDGEEHKNDA